MHSLFADLKGVRNCVDDFLVFGVNRKEHDENLRRFLLRCRKVGLKLNKKKLQYCLPEVKFLGHVVGVQGIAIPKSRVDAIKALKPPKDRRTTRQFLGIINYVSKFIPNAAQLTAPLRLRTRTNANFKWNEDAQNAFETLRDALTEAPVLAHFYPSLKTTVSVDASSYGIGAVLMQHRRPISSASISLTETQAKWSQIEKELLAIVYACEHFRFFLLG